VAALVDDASLVEDENAVGVAHRAEAVGNDEAGAAGHEAFQRFLDETLAGAVEATGRLVEDENAGVLEDGAGDGNALALPAAQLDAALAHGRVIAEWKLGYDEVMRVGGAGGSLDFLVRSVETPVADVGTNRVGEEQGFLGDETNLAAQAGERDVTQVVTIDGDCAGSHVIEAGDEVGECGLAGAAGADEGDDLAGLDMEGDILEEGNAGDVVKVDVVEADRTGDGGQGNRVWLFPDFGRAVKQTEEAFGSAEGRLELGVEAGERGDGVATIRV
jgi:hypothetical protein